MLARIQAAVAAFRAAKHPPYYAVIYDICDGDPEVGMVISEEFYESFGNPRQAAERYRAAFPDEPAHPDKYNNGNARLVIILGDIDEYLP